MTDKDLSLNVLQKLKDGHITPKPRWEFLLKDSAVWTAGIAFLVVGGLATSVILYMFLNDDFSALAEAGDGTIETMLIVMPYFWLLMLAAFIFIAYYNIRHTKKGYRYRLPTILALSMIISTFLGILFYDVGAGQAIDKVLSDKVPTYGRFINPRVLMWSQPEKGMVAGTVTEVVDDHTFRMKDLNDNVWTIHASHTFSTKDIDEQKTFRFRAIKKPEDRVTFEAQHIMPWEPQHKPIFKFMRRSGERRTERRAY